MVEQDHNACVNAWMERTAKGIPSELLVQAFEEAFAALWRRAHQTLGDVTLTAIVDRVLYSGVGRFPILSELKVETTGLRCEGLRENARGALASELEEAIQFVLVEFLTVLGDLTAHILTLALHAELSRVALQERPEDRKAEVAPRSLARKAGRGAKSS
jgi:hypothetical protein